MGERFSADAVVVGAGPAGLGAALGLARKGMDVAVLDMQDRIGSRRRGETIRFDREMDAHLGKGFFERQTIRTIRKRSYFSHTGLRRVDRTIKNPNCIISWPDFIRSMADVVKAAGARIIPASTVVGFLEEKG
ncbi:MAG TPA: FAD-dependent oxidoreductase, partial [Deltaproteobacteria bacterium]|nr:FAD-dependent oxidoreductase [Deltaproteobacteria bacterium]